jgi:hypothetical protein
VHTELITPSDRRWRDLLTRVPHDVYHLPEYTVLAAQAECGKPVAFYAENAGDFCFIPLLIRDLPEELGAPREWCDAISPYGYPSPLTTAAHDAITLSRFMKAFQEFGAELNLVTAFVRLHPLLALAEEGLGAAGRLELQGRGVTLDLQRSAEEVWRGVRGNHRTGIRKLERSGFVAAMDQWEHSPEFILCYEQTMRRVGASQYYFFPQSYYDGLRSKLRDSVHLCTVHAPGGRLASAALLFEEAGIVQYHLGGTVDELLSVAPSKLMMDFGWRWAKQRGNRLFHLGGGLGGQEDSLFHFKAGFSELRPTVGTLRVIFDEERYRVLNNRLNGDPEFPSFFPRYRSPHLRPPP